MSGGHMIKSINIILKVFFIASVFSSCSSLKKVDKSYLNNMAMSLDQNRTPAFSGRGVTLNSGNVGSQTACATCAK
jgi:hypothetical protein